MEDNLITENDVKEYQIRSYEDLSSEFQRLYPRVPDLIQLMYNRLTLVDKLSHKEAIAKIYNDHQHLSGFSRRNIRRNLPLDNATVPRRIRPSWPKNSATETEASELNHSIQGQQADTPIDDDSKETFSKQAEEKSQQQQIARMQEGKSVVTNETFSNTNDINQFHDQSNYGISDDGNNEDKKVNYTHFSLETIRPSVLTVYLPLV